VDKLPPVRSSPGANRKQLLFGRIVDRRISGSIAGRAWIAGIDLLQSDTQLNLQLVVQRAGDGFVKDRVERRALRPCKRVIRDVDFRNFFWVIGCHRCTSTLLFRLSPFPWYTQVRTPRASRGVRGGRPTRRRALL